MITIKEIARSLGMSTTTVSNVIHGKTSQVSAETIERVRKFLEEVDYVPNINARNLAQNQSRIIGVAMKTQDYKYPNLMKDPFVSEMIGGIEKVIRTEGYFMMLYISNDIAEIMRHVSTWNADGLLLYDMLDDDGDRISRRYKKPVVCIDTYSEEGNEGFCNVGLDDEEAAFCMTRYLLENGHRRIAFLADNRIGVDLRRFRGYRRALREAGVEYSDRNFCLLRPEPEERERSLDKICENLREYSAVFCVSDYYACMLMSALRDRNILVPDDISVAGFDDNDYAKLYRPALTTVHQDAEEKGAAAARMLIGLIRGEEPSSGQILLPFELKIRDSVKKLSLYNN